MVGGCHVPTHHDLSGLTALVPMRHHSERVARKNYRHLGGRPLFHHILDTLSRVVHVGRIVVDSDSGVIEESCREWFPDVLFSQRPEHLRDGRISMTDVLKHVAALNPSRWYLQTHSTNPFLSPETIEAAIDRLAASIPVHDSLFTVTPHQARFYDTDGRPLNHDPRLLLRTQDLRPIYEENSCLYIFSAEQVRDGRRMGERPLHFPISGVEALDIDTEDDFALAEAIIGARPRPRGSGQGLDSD